MSKYFLGSVGTAEAFRMVNGSLQLAFVSKTLTDSGLNISTTKDDVRGGTGAPIQFSFYHDPSVEITLTDVIFDEAYIEAQLGTSFTTGGTSYETETVSFAAGVATFGYEPLALSFGCLNNYKPIWYTKPGSNEWVLDTTATIEGTSVTLSDITVAGSYCVRYIRRNDNAKIAEITSQIIPQELYLIITAPIFAGDACSASNGKKAGTITYEIPRFKLNGAQEFTMNMSSNQPMSLAGIALASESGCDMNDAQLVRIIANYDGAHWYDDVTELIADEDYLTTATVPHVYALHKNGTASLIDNDNLTFAPVLSAQGK